MMHVGPESGSPARTEAQTVTAQPADVILTTLCLVPLSASIKRATAGETSPSRHARGDRNVSAADSGGQQGSRLAGVVNTASRWPCDGAKLVGRRLLSYRCGEVTTASRGSSVSLYASQLTWDGQRSLKINVADEYKVPDTSSSCSRARASLH